MYLYFIEYQLLEFYGENLDCDFEKCQTERFEWQNFIRTDKKIDISASYFIVRTDKIFKISPNDCHVQNDFNISA